MGGVISVLDAQNQGHSRGRRTPRIPARGLFSPSEFSFHRSTTEDYDVASVLRRHWRDIAVAEIVYWSEPPPWECVQIQVVTYDRLRYKSNAARRTLHVWEDLRQEFFADIYRRRASYCVMFTDRSVPSDASGASDSRWRSERHCAAPWTSSAASTSSPSLVMSRPRRSLQPECRIHCRKAEGLHRGSNVLLDRGPQPSPRVVPRGSLLTRDQLALLRQHRSAASPSREPSDRARDRFCDNNAHFDKWRSSVDVWDRPRPRHGPHYRGSGGTLGSPEVPDVET